MAGEPLRVGSAFAGKLPRASDFNTMPAREALLGTDGGALAWWLDDELPTWGETVGFFGGFVAAAAGELPNTVYFAPLDWPSPGMLLRRPRVVRVLLVASQPDLNVYYPGDPRLVATTTILGFTVQHAKIASHLLGTIAAAVEASLAGTDVLFAAHQAWLVDEVGDLDLSHMRARFLRALAPLNPGAGFLATDVLNLVFLYEGGGAVYYDGPDMPDEGTPAGVYYATHNFASLDDQAYSVLDGSNDYTGLSATYAADAAAVVAAYPAFPGYRTVLFDCDPGDQGIPVIFDNLFVLSKLAKSRANNAALLTDIAADLAGVGFEYGGSLDPLTDDGSGLVALVAAHFGL